jgi:hypothetical protein
MKPIRLLLALGLTLTLVGCGENDSDNHRDRPGAADERTKTTHPTEETKTPEVVVESEPPETSMDYDQAIDHLHAIVAPSEELITQFGAARDAQDAALIRSLTGPLADSLRTLQRDLENAAWPPETQEAVDAFILGLEDEISWYAYISISATDEETWDALDQPWSNAGVDASNELWGLLDAGL